MRSLLPLALLLCLAAACGRPGADLDAGEARARELVLPRPRAGADPTFAVWAQGPARLHVLASGAGEARVEAWLEGGAPRRIARRALDGATVAFGGALPGEGSRPVHVRLRAPEGVQWREVQLVEHAEEPSPAPDGLAGDLAGRNVAIVLADSVHAGHLSAYGYHRRTSPALEALAERGLRFETAYSQTSWTLPSVATLFTSLEQERHGVQRLDEQLPEGLTTLAELFARAGYRTAGLIQNGIVWPHTRLDRGFDEYGMFKGGPKGTAELVRRARELMDAEDERPLFLYVHLEPPHQPYQPPAPHAGRFVDPDYAGAADGSILSCARANRDRLPADHADVRQLEALYDGNVAWADALLGELLQPLWGRGAEGEWLVVSTSDHGEAFMQHGVQGHNLQVYEEMVRVPLVLAAPESALPAGATVAEPVSLLDLMPTLVELCALEAPAQPTRGRSLLPLLDGESALPPRPLFLTARYRDDLGRLHMGVRLEDWKLVLRGGRPELYDLASDPGEQRDLAAQRPLHAAALRELLEGWLVEARAEGAASERGEIPVAARESMRALGYLGDGEDDLEHDGEHWAER